MLKLRCSSLPNLMTCTPSTITPDGMVAVHNEVDAAGLGTLVHEFAQRIVDSGTYEQEQLKGRYPEDQARAEQLIRNFFTLWSEAKEILTAPQTEVYHETELAPGILLTGHIDLCQIEAEQTLILDYKTGRVHENHYHQIAGYAALAWDKAGRPGKYTVRVQVVYLEDLTATAYTFEAADLEAWVREVVAKLDDKRYIVSRKCAFCPVQGSCPAYREYTQAAIRFLQSDNAQKGKVKWMDVEPEERGSLLDVMYVVEQGIKRVKESLRSAMQGTEKDVRLDIGDNMVYTKVVRTELGLNTKRALPTLRQRFMPEILDEILKADLTDVLQLIGKYSPKNSKQTAKDAFLRKLKSVGAIFSIKRERFERRPADEQELEY